MEDSRQGAGVKKKGDTLSILAHIQELASPLEIFRVLLGRTVEGGEFPAGWILVPGKGGWELLEGYPPLASREVPSFLGEIPFPWGLTAATL